MQERGEKMYGGKKRKSCAHTFSYYLHFDDLLFSFILVRLFILISLDFGGFYRAISLLMLGHVKHSCLFV